MLKRVDASVDAATLAVWIVFDMISNGKNLGQFFSVYLSSLLAGEA